MQQLRFLSKNQSKIDEVKAIMSGIDIEILPVNYEINEIQSIDVSELARKKCVEAFQRIGHPIFVEHTSLEIASMNGFPGGLTQIFWDTLKAEKVSSLFGNIPDNSVRALTRIAYCDGRKILQFEGEVSGNISPEPRGNRDFQWDCIFIPTGEKLTFAEMGQRKNEISMRRKALEKFSEFLKGQNQ